MKTKSIIIFFIALFFSSCAKHYDKNANIEFVKDKYGKLLFAIKNKWGGFPLEMNLGPATITSDSGKKTTVDIFTDKYGHPIKYVWTSNNSFYFICTGPNGKLEDGQNDDYKINYDNGWKD